jgi:D-xylose transport system substrate-binding protein
MSVDRQSEEESHRMNIRKFAAIAGTVMMLTAACSSSTATTAPASQPAASTGGSAAGCVVGVSWNNYQEERWAKWDEPAIKAALAAGGAQYISNDAKSSADTQATNVDNLISQGAKVLIILAQDGKAIESSVAKAKAANIPVIAYDRLIDDPYVLYQTFDNVLVGKMMATEVLKVVSQGDFAIIKGNKADANADFLRAGMVEAGIPAEGQKDPNGKINIVGETYTDNWDGTKAQTEMQQILTANNNKVDAVLSENDGMATGVAAALKAAGLSGIPLSGQDGDKAALNRIALGTQTVSIWKDSRNLGKAAGEAAVQLCTNPDITKVTGVGTFKSPGGNSLTSTLLQPQAITADTLNIVVDANWIDKATLCQGVDPSKAPPACK